MAIETDTAPARAAWVFPARLALGFAQGLALYLLYRADESHAWPASDPLLFAPLLMVALYVPLLVSQAMGTMRLPVLLGWAVVASLIAFGLGFFDRERQPWPFVLINDSDVLPEFATLFFGFAGLFIAQSLILAGDAERRIVAHYERYFDAAWKLGLQLALAAVFVAVFWGVLWFGATLFKLIKLDFLEKLIGHDWFWIPATTLATAAAIELTDVRARLIAGIRGVVLTLLGWLLPLLALIAAGFLASLVFTGFAPLWATRAAAGGLLTAASALVVLINAAYQNGEREGAALLRYAEAVAAFALVPLVAISAYALSLRVGQYGWSVDRFATLDCLIVAVCYAAGYSVAAVLAFGRPGRMALLEQTNIFAAFAVLVLLGLWFTPFTDPAKLSTDDQIARLRAGKVSAEAFDYNTMWSEDGRYGRRALEKLAALKGKGEAAVIAPRAKLVLGTAITVPSKPPGPANGAENLTVYPKGEALPKNFVDQKWSAVAAQATLPPCLTMAGYVCDAVLADLDGDGTDEVIVINSDDELYWWGTVMKASADGRWSPVATLPAPHCAGDLEALRAGTYKLVPPPAPIWRELDFGGHRTAVTLPESIPAPCPRPQRALGNAAH